MLQRDGRTRGGAGRILVEMGTPSLEPVTRQIIRVLAVPGRKHVH